MKNLNPQYLKNLIFFTAIIESLTLGFFFLFPDSIFWLFFVIPSYFLSITIIFHILLMRSAAKRAQTFISQYMLFTGIRLALNIAALIGSVVLFKQDVIAFASVFIIQYFIYTFLEIRDLLRFFSKSQSGHSSE